MLTHISWDLLWASLFAGVAFLVAHASYMVLSAHRKRDAVETDRLEAARTDLPARIGAPLAGGASVPLGDGGGDVRPAVHGVPADRRRAVRLGQWHWMAGLVLTASIVFHIIHATVWMDFWSIWVGPKDIPELKAELMRELGREVDGPKPGKYPLGNRLYHMAIVLSGLVVVTSGLFMMVRVRTPLFIRNPYLLNDAKWGFTYVAHGLAGVALVGLVIAHVYFAVRPEKWWITKSMILGWITRRQYLEHHDPQRWIAR